MGCSQQFMARLPVVMLIKIAGRNIKIAGRNIEMLECRNVERSKGGEVSGLSGRNSYSTLSLLNHLYRLPSDFFLPASSFELPAFFFFLPSSFQLRASSFFLLSSFQLPASSFQLLSPFTVPRSLNN